MSTRDYWVRGLFTLDVRLPIACLFLIGVFLAGYGILAPHPEVEVKPGFNVNLYWGSVMVVLAVVLLAGAKWSSRHKNLSDSLFEGEV